MNPKPKQRRQHIEAGWRSFEAAVLEEHIGPVQRREMRRAFYAGANVLFHALLANVSDGDEQTPEDDALGDDIRAELGGFLADIKAGRA